jgi:elongation factor Ts
MSDITPVMIKQLRDRTDMSMALCKEALIACDGDFEKATDYMRQKGAMKGAKLNDRDAKNGLVAVKIADDSKSAVITELRCETDFVERGEHFNALLGHTIAALSANGGDFNKAQASLQSKVAEFVGLIGENIVFARGAGLSGDFVSHYIHNGIKVAPYGGKIAVVLALNSVAGVEAGKVADLGKKICMHIAASSPIALDRGSFPASVLERERAIYVAKASESGKPANIVEKMVDGMISKFLAESVLLEQPFVMDPTIKVSDFVNQFNATHGASVTLGSFIRYQIG